jgi:SPP1 gp7 family putative phage head morphogenesis protein
MSLFDDWKPIRQNVSRYLRDLEAFIEKFVPWSVTFGHDPTLSLPPVSEEDLISAASEQMARRMLTGVLFTNAQSWRAAARHSFRTRRIYESLRAEMGGPLGMRVDELVRGNVKLIQRIPDVLNARAAAYVGREQRRGRRAEYIAKDLEAKMPSVRQSLVTMLARTEVGRAETAVTQARAERLNLPWYEWATAEDRRVRPSHRKMDKMMVAWNDPPSPEALIGEPSRSGHYAPGQTYNCRCIALPLIDVDQVQWPHKIYEHGHVSTISRTEFERYLRHAQAAA